jgi:fructose-1,6-bisphosphatase/sedoheptulose 1,7-bisphosphatase-like protein
MDSVNATTNFLHILDNVVSDNLEKVAENKGITVQELITVFQKSDPISNN